MLNHHQRKQRILSKSKHRVFSGMLNHHQRKPQIKISPQDCPVTRTIIFYKISSVPLVQIRFRSDNKKRATFSCSSVNNNSVFHSSIQQELNWLLLPFQTLLHHQRFESDPRLLHRPNSILYVFL